MIEEAYLKLSHEEKRLFARYAGRTIREVPKAIIPLYRVMESQYIDGEGKAYRVKEEAFFTALAIRCMFENNEGVAVSPEDYVKKGRESKSLRSQESYDKKIAAMMENTEKEFFSFKLAKLIAYTSELVDGCIPDCERLYVDICCIDNPGKNVQRRWARKIYS